MNTVVFDLLFAQPQEGSKFHGGGEYIKSIFKGMIEQYDASYVFEVCYDRDAFLDDWILDAIEELAIIKHYVKTAEDIVQVLREKVKTKTSKVHFFAGMVYPYSQVVFPQGVVTIGTCHGLRALEKPYDKLMLNYCSGFLMWKRTVKEYCFRNRHFQFMKTMYEKAIDNFDIVITDSEHSAYAVQMFFPEISKKKQIRVYYAPQKHAERISDNPDGQQSYILMISANRWVKNSCRGVLALDNLYEKGLLEGVKTHVYGCLPEKIQKKMKHPEQFELYGYVSSEELERAYRDCSVFFYPTLNEGFGLPPLEAMKYGKTCVVSAVCSLPEIYGESVYYCNPYDIGEMGNRILQAIEKPISREVIQEKIDKTQLRQNEDLKKLCKLIKEGC